MSNEDLILVLDDLKGIGRWTAEMLLIFSLNRMDIFSKQDLGIKRGISMIYHHQKITDDLMKKYEKRYSPYGSLASLYLWEISSGQYGHQDYQVK
jgi:DNA-3-methyladenine glycosylase II